MIYASGVTNPATVSGDAPLQILLPGIQIPGNPNYETGNPAIFYWTAITAQSQNAAQGVYYIKVEQTDSYGHVTSFIKNVTVVNSQEYIELNIYNGAGEIVRSIRKTGPVTDPKLMLEIDDVIAIESTGSPVLIKYGQAMGSVINWDGKNHEGKVVSTGSYEVQVIIHTAAGETMSTKTIVVLREQKNYLDSLVIIPNPYSPASGYTPVVFRWTAGTETGSAFIKIYNIAGELVKTLTGKIEDPAGLSWDTYITKGERAGTGLYICVLETRNTEGYTNRKVEKLAIAGYEAGF